MTASGRGKDSRYVRLPADLVERADRAGIALPAICVLAVATACDAVESGQAQTLTFGFVVTKTLDVQRAAAEADPA